VPLTKNKVKKILKKNGVRADWTDKFMEQLDKVQEVEEDEMDEENLIEDPHLGMPEMGDDYNLSSKVADAQPSQPPNPPQGPSLGPTATEKKLEVPAYRTPYSAAESSAKDLLIRAITLEEGKNINDWEVKPSQFPAVAEAWNSGRQIRLNHEGKQTEKVIGKSFKGMVSLGRDIETNFGVPLSEFGLTAADINPSGKYVLAWFKATPEDPQVRTNMLNRYVWAGSIGLAGDGSCKECGKPVYMGAEGFEKTCDHIASVVEMDNVDVKEWSVVPEPAYAHTTFYPSFITAAATLHASKKAMEQPTNWPVGEADPKTPVDNPPTAFKDGDAQVILGSVMTDQKEDVKDKVDAEAKFGKLAEAMATLASALAANATAEAKKADADACRDKAEAEAKKADADAEAKRKAEANAEAKKKAEADAASDKAGSTVQAVAGQPDYVAAIFHPRSVADKGSLYIMNEGRRQRGLAPF
jgi:hypothetical protein